MHKSKTMKNQAFQFYNLLIFFLLLTTACNLDETDVDSHGGIDEVLVLADDANWEKSVKSAIEKSFEEPYPVLPQPESSIKVTHVAFNKFENIFKRYRNILIVADLEDNSAITKLTLEYLGENLVAKAFNNPDFFVGKKNDIWAKDQYVVFVFAPGKAKLDSVLSNKANLIRNLFLQNDLKRYYGAAMSIGASKEIQNTINEKFGFSIDIPSDYFVAKNESKLLWLRKETEEVSFNIMIEERNLNDITLPANAVEWRNELGKAHVSSQTKGAYMVSDSTLPIEISNIAINGKTAKQYKGLWRLEKDFMGGPFITYYVEKPELNKAYLIDAFIYAPGTKKKPQVRRLEALIGTLKF
jgi:hypothetical protein